MSDERFSDAMVESLLADAPAVDSVDEIGAWMFAALTRLEAEHTAHMALLDVASDPTSATHGARLAFAIEASSKWGETP